MTQLKDALREEQTASWNRWKANATAEQQAMGLREGEEMKNNEEKRNEVMAMLTQCFQECDSDQDGYLTPDEYETWARLQFQKQKEKGQYVDENGGLINKYKEVANSIEPESPGISLANIFTMMGASMALIEELKAADSQ